MSGSDFLFAPESVCQQFLSNRDIQLFLKKVQAIVGSSRTRTTIVSFWRDNFDLLHFERYNMIWKDGQVVNVSKELLDDNPQQDFILMMYQHSEPLMAVARM